MNYWEMLSCLGIVGAIMYYSIHVYILNKLWKISRCQKKPLTVLLVTIMLLLTVLDYASVTFQGIFTITMIGIIFCYCEKE